MQRLPNTLVLEMLKVKDTETSVQTTTLSDTKMQENCLLWSMLDARYSQWSRDMQFTV